jgi:hypothetical protein
MNMKRSKASQDRVGSTATDYSFNQESGALKTLGPILGKVSIMGALNAAKAASKMGRLIAVYNNSSSVAWAKTGPNSSVTAPTGGADGIALTPNAYTIIAMGSDLFIIASAATCFGYEISDELEYNPNSGSNT